jgi:hypothetical protein
MGVNNLTTNIYALMKSLSLFIFALAFSTLSFGQQWIDLGLKGSFGANMLYNKTIFDTKQMNVLMGYGHSFGARVGYNLNLNHEIALEGLSSQFKQEFAYDLRFDEPNHFLTAKNYDVLLLYRKNGTGNYIEVGPQFSKVHSAEVTYSNTGPKGVELIDTENFIRPSYVSLVIGFGAYYPLADNIGFNIGARFKYGLNDLISVDGKQAGYPYGPLKQPTAAPSLPIVAEIVAELNFDLAYMAGAKCGKKGKKLRLFR